MTARKKAADPAERAVESPEAPEQDVVEPKPAPVPGPGPGEPGPPEQPTEPLPTGSGLVYFLPSSNTMGTTTESGATFALSVGIPVKMTAADAAALVAEGLGSIKGD